MADLSTTNSGSDERRARLCPKPKGIPLILEGSPILKPLLATNGMVWPYQPTINYTQTVDYQTVPLVHTNQDFYAFTRSPTPELTVEGEFTVQNQKEGLYALAAIHFLRVVTKMYFGASQKPGTPPPVLLFDAYGSYIFNKLPVIVTTFTSNLTKDGDYVAIKTNDGTQWLPAIFNISVTMKIQNTPAKLQQFDLDKFRTGEQLKGGGWL
jgi:hypothetical protein